MQNERSVVGDEIGRGKAGVGGDGRKDWRRWTEQSAQ